MNGSDTYVAVSQVGFVQSSLFSKVAQSYPCHYTQLFDDPNIPFAVIDRAIYYANLYARALFSFSREQEWIHPFTKRGFLS
jgi:hypothetical protein